VQTIRPEMPFSKLIELIRNGRRNLIAVVTAEKELEGIISLDDLRPFMFNKELYDTLDVRQVMTSPPAVIHAGSDMRAVIKKFDETGTWTLPVIDGDEKFVGFISRSAILNSYRGVLRGYSN
jgi:CIC family chloride channel protein